MENKRILIVDDEVEICDPIQMFLSGKGYEIETAQDAATAYSKGLSFSTADYFVGHCYA